MGKIFLRRFLNFFFFIHWNKKAKELRKTDVKLSLRTNLKHPFTILRTEMD